MRSLHFLFAVTAGTAFFHAALGTKDHFVGYVDPGPLSTPDLSVRDALGNHAGLMRREDITKPPAVTCPEEVSAQPLACSADICGGEDPKKPGQCAKEKCKCNMDTSAKPIMTTVVATQSGKTVTGSYALQTLSSYASLRQALTTTVTRTTTNTDGSSGVETAAAVILAGGVSWFLAGYLGEAAVAEEALETPESDENDGGCPSTKQSCFSCLGILNMCTVGPSSGCVCDSDSCPTGDQQPECSDPKCKGGDDKKCSADNKGCACVVEEKEECPKGFNTLMCHECGGATDDKKCKGLSDENDKWKDCNCIDIGEGNLPYYTCTEEEELAFAAELASLPRITDGSFASNPLNGDPVCLKLGWGAPQKEDDGENSVTKNAKEWCKSIDGKSIKRDDNILYEHYPVSYYEYWLSAEYWFESIDSSCGTGDRKISEEECTDTLTTAMTECEPDSKECHGASLVGKCIKYNITLAETDPDGRPPWKAPLPKDTVPVCNTDRYSSVQSKFFKGLYPSFCEAVNKDKTKALKKSLTNKDFKPASKRSLLARSPPVDDASYEEYSFNFEWSGTSDPKAECFKDCNSAFENIVGSPCGKSGMAYKTTADVGCGSYSYSIDSDKRQCAIDPSFIGDTKMVAWDEDAAKKSIQSFCVDDAKQFGFLVDPATPQPPKEFSQTRDSYPHQKYRNGASETEHVTDIFVAFTEDAGGRCAEAKSFKISDYSDRCKEILGKIINKPDHCPNDTGGNIKEESDGHGCVTWQMFQYNV